MKKPVDEGANISAQKGTPHAVIYILYVLLLPVGLEQGAGRYIVRQGHIHVYM